MSSCTLEEYTVTQSCNHRYYATMLFRTLGNSLLFKALFLGKTDSYIVHQVLLSIASYPIGLVETTYKIATKINCCSVWFDPYMYTNIVK